MNTLEVISAIARSTHIISSFTFHQFPKQQLVQDSDINWSEKEQYMLDKALKLKKMGIPFWDGIMLSTFNNPNFSEGVLKKALRHNSHPQLIHVSKEQLFSWIEEQTPDIDRYAFCSKVLLDNGEERHLTLIDFHIPVSETNVKVVECVCRKLGLLKGWILNSGESYHFIGREPILSSDLEMLVYKALMFTPIIDKAWISHQLREHSCWLRIGRKNGLMPETVKEL